MTEAETAAMLNEARDRVLARVYELRRSFDAVVESATSANLDDEHDPEGATVGFERAQLRALLDQARANLEELDDARARFARGEYGCCEGCGRRIGRERLEAQPATRWCVSCAKAEATRD